jgi:hypothetical protein
MKAKTMSNINEQVQHLSQDTVGKVLVSAGGGGTVLQVATEYANIFITWGNVALVIGGLYLMALKFFHKGKNRRKGDRS